MLKEKIVIIVGGLGFLGKELTRSVLDNCAKVIVADIAEASLGNNYDYVKVDINDKKSINKMLNFVSEKFGKIDAVVNTTYPRNENYGRKFEDVEYKDFCENVNLHLGGYFLLSQQGALFFKKQGFGNIINFASIYGVIAPKFDVYNETEMTMPVEYSAIKSGVIHLTKYMANYFKGFNIRFNSISPGGLLNGQHDEFLKKYKSHCLNKGMLDPKDISGTLIYLLSEQSEFVNGQNFVVDDGFSL